MVVFLPVIVYVLRYVLRCVLSKITNSLSVIQPFHTRASLSNNRMTDKECVMLLNTYPGHKVLHLVELTIVYSHSKSKHTFCPITGTNTTMHP